MLLKILYVATVRQVSIRVPLTHPVLHVTTVQKDFTKAKRGTLVVHIVQLENTEQKLVNLVVQIVQLDFTKTKRDTLVVHIVQLENTEQKLVNLVVQIVQLDGTKMNRL